MIVKNESEVIVRCLSSLKSLIDYWVIVDTGSEDNTKEIIKEFMQDIPGELHERPWKNFAHNRNEALSLAKGKGDYVLIIDADEVFETDPSFKMPHLTHDFYHIMTHFGGSTYARAQLIKNNLDWEWKGVLHEGLYSTQACLSSTLKGIRNIVRSDGARSKDPKKYEKDAEILEKAVAEEPDNSRYVFYLAQSYKDCLNYSKAIEWYQKRVDMGGWDQEVFWSLFQIARMKELIEAPEKEIVAAYYKAYHYRPTRAEPLYYLASYYRRHDNPGLAYLTVNVAKKIPFPKDILFVEKWIYDYGNLFELSIASYWIGKYEKCQKLSLQLLSMELPISVQECLKRNLSFANEKLIQLYVSGRQPS